MSGKEVLDSRGLTEEEFLKIYKPGDYERPSVTVDMLLFTTKQETVDYKKLNKFKLQIGLIKRKGHPFINHWAICGGFVDMKENLDEAAKRELLEETNISDVYMEQLYTFGDVGRDPRMRVIDVAYYALIPEQKLKESKYKAGDDASDIAFFDISLKDNYLILINEEKEEFIQYRTDTFELSAESTSGLAFDHIKILYMAIKRMQNKLFYTDIAFHLLPEEFTLSEVQIVFETILNKPLVKQNFRTKILNTGLLEETDKKFSGKGYRPSMLYKLKTT